LKKVLFTIRRQYFDAIISGEKTEELRADIPHWSWLLGPDPPQVAVFMCGHDIHRRYITDIYRAPPEEILGRPVSEQGRKDLRLPDPKPNCLPGEWSPVVIVVELGEVFK